MAISLKELSEKIFKPGFWSPDYKNKISISSGYTCQSNGYIHVDGYTSTVRNSRLWINDVLLHFNFNDATRVYYTTTNLFLTVGVGDKITFDGIFSGKNVYFIPAILTIYYIVRYNIYKLVRFLSHLNTKFGGERR